MAKRLFTLGFLFLGVSLFADPLHMVGSMRLGDPVRQDDGRYRVPVIITTDADSAAPQAFCFRLDFSAPVTAAIVQHSGVTAGREATFEWQNAAAGNVSYLVVYDPAALSLPAGVSIVVAEVVIAYRDTQAPLAINFDASSLTMIGNQSGTLSATQAKGTLAVAGMIIDPSNRYFPPSQRRRSSGR